MFERVIEIKFFSRAISSDEKVEKEIEIQREAVQLTDGAGQKFKGNPNSNCCVGVRESKTEFELKLSDHRSDFSKRLCCKVDDSR